VGGDRPHSDGRSPERSVAELLWTRADELPGPRVITSLLGTLVDHGQLDPAKAVAWSFVRTIDYWLWGPDDDSQGSGACEKDGAG
jgi:streptomycin 6-kinase